MLTAISVVMLVTNSIIFPKDSPAGSKQQAQGNVFTHYKSIFTNRTGNVILTLSFVLFFIYFAVIVYLPILLTEHYHIDVSIAGLLYLPLALSTIAGTFLFKNTGKSRAEHLVYRQQCGCGLQYRVVRRYTFRFSHSHGSHTGAVWYLDGGHPSLVLHNDHQ